MTCKARQQSDEMFCHVCKLRWDVNDPSPPLCPERERRGVSAAGILSAAAAEMQDRAVTYDKPEGERSMAATVNAFNAATGHSLTETQGWQFMEILKLVRSNQGAHRLDSFVDGAAYAALAGEAAERGAGT